MHVIFEVFLKQITKYSCSIQAHSPLPPKKRRRKQNKKMENKTKMPPKWKHKGSAPKSWTAATEVSSMPSTYVQKMVTSSHPC